MRRYEEVAAGSTTFEEVGRGTTALEEIRGRRRPFDEAGGRTSSYEEAGRGCRAKNGGCRYTTYDGVAGGTMINEQSGGGAWGLRRGSEEVLFPTLCF